MPLLQELKKLSQEGMMSERLTGQLRALLPQFRGEILAGVETLVNDEIKRQIGAIRVRDGRDGRDGKPGRTPTKNEVLEIIKPLLPEEKELEIEKVKGLRGFLDNLSNRITSIGSRKTRGGGGGGDTIIADDLSSQVNGSTRTFNTTKRIGKPLLVVSSQFPQVLRLTTDFTASGTVLTLDSAVPVIVSGQTLYFIYAEG